MEILTNEILQVIMWVYVGVYGIVLGISNTLKKLKWLITSNYTIRQSLAGEALDAIFYITIAILIYTN
tara:strand:+ start:1391 stop:1594 length:204 start_codon:yes stop_codon:yes gene_type:complete